MPEEAINGINSFNTIKPRHVILGQTYNSQTREQAIMISFKNIAGGQINFQLPMHEAVELAQAILKAKPLTEAEIKNKIAEQNLAKERANKCNCGRPDCMSDSNVPEDMLSKILRAIL